MLGLFHNRVARRITGRFATAAGGGGVILPPLGDRMRAAGVEEIERYMSRQ